MAMPTIRNSATSGILIFCARKAVTVPIARISPQDSSVCWAISMEEDVCTQVKPGLVRRLQPRTDFAGRDIGLLQ